MGLTQNTALRQCLPPRAVGHCSTISSLDPGTGHRPGVRRYPGLAIPTGMINTTGGGRPGQLQKGLPDQSVSPTCQISAPQHHFMSWRTRWMKVPAPAPDSSSSPLQAWRNALCQEQRGIARPACCGRHQSPNRIDHSTPRRSALVLSICPYRWTRRNQRACKRTRRRRRPANIPPAQHVGVLRPG